MLLLFYFLEDVIVNIRKTKIRISLHKFPVIKPPNNGRLAG
jgi:hypothetical protein